MNGRQVALTLLTIGLLALWMIATAAVFALVELRDTALLGWSLAGAVVITSLARPFRGAAVAITLLAAAAYLGAQIHRMVVLQGLFPDLRYLLAMLPGIACLVVAGLLSAIVSRQLSRIRAQMEQDTAAVQELTRHDDVTGVLKDSYANRLLSLEIERARRYQRPLSVVLLAAEDWEAHFLDRGVEEADEKLATIGKLLVEGLRAVDVVARGGESRFLAILPETPAEGAQLAAERICETMAEKAGLQFRAGVAQFPDDGVSREELAAEAEAALQFARQAGITVASRSLLS